MSGQKRGRWIWLQKEDRSVKGQLGAIKLDKSLKGSIYLYRQVMNQMSKDYLSTIEGRLDPQVVNLCYM